MKIVLLLTFALFANFLMAQKINLDSILEKNYLNEPSYLVFEDNFDGDSINTNLWTVQYGHLRGFDAELQMYMPQNVEVSDGTLKLWMIKDSVTGPCKSGVGHGIAWNDPITKGYSSGEIDSKRTFLYGKFEARAKCPAGDKFWPAFWLQNGGGDKKNYCEIDALEAWGTSHANCTVHDFSGSSSPHAMNPYNYHNFSFNEWHTYTVEWTPLVIRFYIDYNFATEVFHYTEKKKRKGIEEEETETIKEGFEQLWPYPNPSKIIFNFALASFLPGTPDSVLPAAFEVDYVRAWQPVPSFEISGPTDIARNNAAPQHYSVPAVDGAKYTWSFSQFWTGKSSENKLTVYPDSIKGGNLSVILTFADGQEIVKDINVHRVDPHIGE